MDLKNLLSTFALIFVAELGDKTQLAVVTQVCKYRRPWAVFWGASLGLTAVTALGVAGGQALSRVVPPSALQIVAALVFVIMGLLMAREAAKASPDRSLAEICDEDGVEPDGPPGISWPAFGSTLGLLFVAEMGDKTQLAVMGLAGRSIFPGAVFVGGALALIAVTALGVVGGQALCRLVPERVLLWVSAVAFVVLGVLTGLGVP